MSSRQTLKEGLPVTLYLDRIWVTDCRLNPGPSDASTFDLKLRMFAIANHRAATAP
jgi:hypothetical protein